MIQVLINGIDRSTAIRFGSLRTTDRINQASDVCTFTVDQYGALVFKPKSNDEVIVTVDGVRTFGGVVVVVEQSRSGPAALQYAVQCKDYTQYLNRKLVVERYQDTDVRTIVLDLIDRYADEYGFTADANVFGGDFGVASIAFNELTLSACLDKLAKLTTYSWYVDYYKDIHFFKKNDELAPFNLTETSGNYIYDSLVLTDDFSQIRNRVKVRGGEARAEERTKLWAGDGENDTFATDHKFAELPVVMVEGVEKTVGVDYLDKDEDFDVMWNFQQKYIRFTPGNIPDAPLSGETNIEITGIPLKPVVVLKQHNPSVVQYGVYEFVKYNDSLKTRDEALQFAAAELEAYAFAIKEGSFDTYVPGLRSGQTIQIVSTLRGVNEKFLIQSVRYEQVSNEVGIYRVELATLRTVSIIDILQDLIQEERISEGEDETLLNFFALGDSFGITDQIGAITTFPTRDYVWEQGDPMSDSYPNPIVWNIFTWD